MNDRLKVTYVENKATQPSVQSPISRRLEMQATMERLWHQKPGQFDPERDCIQRQRVQRTIEALHHRMSLTDKRVVDLGCGAGYISRLLRDGGAKVDAVDVATNALQKLKTEDLRDITPIQDCLPNTRLDDNAYDLVVCTEVVGYLDPKEYRLLFAELARLVKLDGIVACSTDLDIDSEAPLERFALLAETEFIFDQWILSYHRLFLKICRFLEAPALYIKAANNMELRTKQKDKRKALSRWWFAFNSTPIMSVWWRVVNFIAAPLASAMRQSERVLRVLERITRFVWSESGISHALLIGRKRPLTYPLPDKEKPREIKHKRQVWE